MNIDRKFYGRALIILGAAVWLPFVVKKYIQSVPVNMTPYLIVHLLGVVPGILIRRGPETLATVQRLLSRRQKEFENET